MQIKEKIVPLKVCFTFLLLISRLFLGLVYFYPQMNGVYVLK
jgi:hypothetical protein